MGPLSSSSVYVWAGALELASVEAVDVPTCGSAASAVDFQSDTTCGSVASSVAALGAPDGRQLEPSVWSAKGVAASPPTAWPSQRARATPPIPPIAVPAWAQDLAPQLEPVGSHTRPPMVAPPPDLQRQEAPTPEVPRPTLSWTPSPRAEVGAVGRPVLLANLANRAGPAKGLRHKASDERGVAPHGLRAQAPTASTDVFPAPRLAQDTSPRLGLAPALLSSVRSVVHVRRSLGSKTAPVRHIVAPPPVRRLETSRPL